MANGMDGSKKRLLYVDDDEMALNSLQMLLSKEYDVDIADTPQRALRLVKKKIYDAILMDIALSDKTDGVELSNRIKEINEYRKTPIIALTAYASRRDKLFFLEHGLDYYISKPFFKKDILKLLEKVFSKEEAINDVV